MGCFWKGHAQVLSQYRVDMKKLMTPKKDENASIQTKRKNELIAFIRFERFDF